MSERRGVDVEDFIKFMQKSKVVDDQWLFETKSVCLLEYVFVFTKITFRDFFIKYYFSMNNS